LDAPLAVLGFGEGATELCGTDRKATIALRLDPKPLKRARTELPRLARAVVLGQIRGDTRTMMQGYGNFVVAMAGQWVLVSFRGKSLGKLLQQQARPSPVSRDAHAGGPDTP
jgi:hypothetical protein